MATLTRTGIIHAVMTTLISQMRFRIHSIQQSPRRRSRQARRRGHPGDRREVVVVAAVAAAGNNRVTPANAGLRGDDI